jgi:hypothetical protein
MTLVEVLVILAVLAFVAFMYLPYYLSRPQPAHRINCVNNLKEIGLAYKVWAEDNNDKYPMQVSIADTNGGGTMELAATGNVVATFQILSNELSTPKLLYCTADKDHTCATNFTTDFSARNISYFVGLEANTNFPQAFLSGDDNFAVDGIPVKSGLVQFPKNSTVAWASGRHISYNSHFWTPAHDKYVGNIGLPDGSVQMITTHGLQQAIQNTGPTTNRLAIP